MKKKIKYKYLHIDYHKIPTYNYSDFCYFCNLFDNYLEGENNNSNEYFDVYSKPIYSEDLNTIFMKIPNDLEHLLCEKERKLLLDKLPSEINNNIKPS